MHTHHLAVLVDSALTIERMHASPCNVSMRRLEILRLLRGEIAEQVIE